MQLEDREAVQRGIRDLDTLVDEQLANVGESDAVAESALDRGPLVDAPRPPTATRSPAGGMQREQDLPDVLVADRR